MPLLPLPFQLSLGFLIVVTGNHRHRVPLGVGLRRQSYRCTRIIRLLRLCVEKLRCFYVAISLRYVTGIIQRKRAVGIQRVGLKKFFARRVPVIAINRRNTSSRQQRGARLFCVQILQACCQPLGVGSSHLAHRPATPCACQRHHSGLRRAR